MAKKRQQSEMGGLLDWLNRGSEGSIFDVFGPKKEGPKKELTELPALPAPKTQLPTVRKEALPAPKETLREKLLSFFDVFETPQKETGLTFREQFLPQAGAPSEAKQELVEKKEAPWEVMFPEQEERPLWEMFSVSEPEQEREAPQYQFIPSGLKKIPYGVGDWQLPSVEELASHLEEKIDLEKVFGELQENRMTWGYQDLLAESTFNGIPLYTPISVIDDKNIFTDFADFYGVPWNVVESVRNEEDWHRILRAHNIVLTEAFEMLKPEDMPGFFTVGYNDEKKAHYLYYVEPWLGRIPGP